MAGQLSIKHWLFALFILAATDVSAGTDFERDIQQIDVALASCSSRSQTIHLLYKKACLTGSIADIKKALDAVQSATIALGGSQEGYAIIASLQLKLHRVDEAKSVLEKIPPAQWDQDYILLQADIAEQMGDYAEAASLCNQTMRYGEHWDAWARLAHLGLLTGNRETAKRYYDKAESLITVKDMRSLAWIEIQQGRMEFEVGNYTAARSFYNGAEKTYSGHWLTQAALAELDAAQGDKDSAVARYRKLISSTGNPVFQAALGEFYLSVANTDSAKPLLETARKAFLASAESHDRFYLHYLAHYYSDTEPSPADAVRWAQEDWRLRPNAFTADTLAWALFRENKFEEAAAASKRTMSFGVRNPYILYHAGMILLASDNSEFGKSLIREAARLNPNYAKFHAHY